MGLNGSRTHHNLKAAFAAESEANRRYVWFAEQADVEGFPEIAVLFRAIAENETGHAFGHLEYLAEVGDPATGEPIGDTIDNVRSAVLTEKYESETMYAGFVETAREEGLTEIAEWFESLVGAEKRNAERLALGLETLE
jgi:rubrerythrin